MRKIVKLSWRCYSLQKLQMYLGKTELVQQHLALLRFFQICNIFSTLINPVFFTPGIGRDILMRVFEDYILFLIFAVQALFSFYLKQKQRFSELSFTENVSFIPFHEGICSISKNALNKYRFQSRSFKYNKPVCFS